MKRRIKRNLVTLQATGAALCFGGGILAGIIGSILTASTWIVGVAQHPWVRGIGTALLIATIPLLIFAGYCMDWIESDSKKPLDSTSHKGERGSSPVFQTFTAAIVFSVVLFLPLDLRAHQSILNLPRMYVLDNAKAYVQPDLNTPCNVNPYFRVQALDSPASESPGEKSRPQRVASHAALVKPPTKDGPGKN